MRKFKEMTNKHETLADMEVVKSPCVRNCSLDEQRVCRGCFRHLDEIMRWPEAGEAQRQDILERAATRRGLEEAISEQDSIPA